MQAKKAFAKKSRSARTTKRAKTYHNYINGRWAPSRSGEWIENRNPADTRDLIGRFPLSTSDDLNAAVTAATNAFDGWRLTPAPRRAELLFRAIHDGYAEFVIYRVGPDKLAEIFHGGEA